MIGVGMVGVDIQNLLISIRRFAKPAGLMRLQPCLNGCVEILFRAVVRRLSGGLFEVCVVLGFFCPTHWGEARSRTFDVSRISMMQS